MRISAPSGKTVHRVAAFVLVALIAAGSFAISHAQVAPPPPAPPPLTRPSVPNLPGAPRPLVSVPYTQPTPLATPMPVPTAQPTPGPRAFNCSCFTAASGTEWAGTVLASNFTAARRAATGACVAYVARIPSSAQLKSKGTTGPNTTASGAVLVGPLGQAQPKPPLAQLQAAPALTGQTICNLCACD